MISSFARPSPTTCGSREEPPTSGIRPTPRLRQADDRVGRHHAQVAGQRELQRAADAGAVDLRRPSAWSSPRRGSTRRGTRGGTGAGARAARPAPASAARSMPEENIGPAPRRTTQRTAGSSAAARSASPTREHELVVERVALLGAVEDDVADRAAVLGDHEGHGIGATSLRRSRSVRAMPDVDAVGPRDDAADSASARCARPPHRGPLIAAGAVRAHARDRARGAAARRQAAAPASHLLILGARRGA